MASGDLLVAALDDIEPAAAPALDRVIVSASNENIRVLEFVDGGVRRWDFYGRMPPFWAGGTGLVVKLAWRPKTATTGNAVIPAGFRRFDAAEDTDNAHGYAFQSVTAAAPATLGFLVYSQISFTNAQIDSLAPGELFCLRFERDPANASDTLTDAVLLAPASVQIFEA